MLSELSKNLVSGATQDLYAAPRNVTSLDECYFYHTMDIPGHGHVEGQWDLREGVERYLGGVDFRGKRVLEIGTASGFLCFHMERQGAEVVAYDLSEKQTWDLVPFVQYDYRQAMEERQAIMRKINNGYWLCHKAFRSTARVVYGTVYAVPEAIGPVDVATVGCVLLHLRDPFLALANALRLVRETAVITEYGDETAVITEYGDASPAVGDAPRLTFLPDFRTCHPKETWWQLSPDVICKFIGVLGFEETTVTHHRAKCQGRVAPLFTVVGRRTKGGPGR